MVMNMMIVIVTWNPQTVASRTSPPPWWAVVGNSRDWWTRYRLRLAVENNSIVQDLITNLIWRLCWVMSPVAPLVRARALTKQVESLSLLHNNLKWSCVSTNALSTHRSRLFIPFCKISMLSEEKERENVHIVDIKKHIYLHLVQSWKWSGQTRQEMARKDREEEFWQLLKRFSGTGRNLLPAWWSLANGSRMVFNCWWLMAETQWKMVHGRWRGKSSEKILKSDINSDKAVQVVAKFSAMLARGLSNARPRGPWGEGRAQIIPCAALKKGATVHKWILGKPWPNNR